MDDTSGINKPALINQADWKVETLLKKAYERTKDRFLSYVLSLVIVWGGSFLLVLATTLIIGGIVGVSVLSHQAVITSVGVALVVLCAVLALFYFWAWASLAFTEVMIQESKRDVVLAFKTVKPLVLGFAGVQSVLLLFLLGLTPFIILSLGIVGILWMFWISFMQFVYLENRKRGIDSIWFSKAIMNQHFWLVVKRMLLLSASLFFIQILLTVSHVSLLKYLGTILSLLSVPFSISYNYELYKNIEQPSSYKKPTGWIVASIIGWVLLLGVISLSIGAAAKNMPYMMDQFKKDMMEKQRPSNRMYPPQKNFPDGSPKNSYQL